MRADSRAFRKAWEWLRPVWLVAAVIFPFRSVVADWNVVPTGSMKPTIVEGDRILVDKLAYDLKFPFTTWRLAEWGSPGRGDIVVLYAPDDGTRLVKRVIALPGDVLEIRGGALLINGISCRYTGVGEAPAVLERDERTAHVFAREQLGERLHAVMHARRAAPGRFFGPVSVPEGRYFVMGDNRDNSRDSRAFGFAERSEILGRATRVLVSLDPERFYLPRAGRVNVTLH